MLDEKSIQQKMALALRRKVFSLKSNGGILKKSNRVTNNGIPNNLFSIKGKEAFPICYDIQKDDEILVFARGHQFNKKNHPALPTIFKQLNKGESITFEAMRKQLEPAWELSAIFGLIGDLLQVEAIISM